MKFFAKESTTVGLWHFEETSGTTQSDGSGNGYTLTDNANAPTRITTPDFGGGLQFDGADDFTERSGTSANLEATTFTIEVLLRKLSPHSGDIDQVIEYSPKGSWYDGRGWWMSVKATGELGIGIGSGDGSWNSTYDSIPMPLDRWLYYAGTYDGASVRLYRCGTLVAGPTGDEVISYVDSPGAGPTTYKTCRVGASQDNDANPRSFFKGEIADIRISNIAKSDSAIYNEHRIQQYCETEPTAATIPPPLGGGLSLPFAPYQRYKSIRAAIAQYNNLVIGP